MKTVPYLTSMIIAGSLSLPAAAVVVYDEDVLGDFSNDAGSPTPIVLLPGESSVSGTIGGTEGRDVFSFNVPVGGSITSLTLDEYDQDNTTGIDVNVDGGDLGLVTIRDEVVGEELLGRKVLTSDVALPSTLGPGDYVFNLSEFGGALNYTLTFTTQFPSIPEPASGMLLAGLGLPLLRRRRRA